MSQTEKLAGAFDELTKMHNLEILMIKELEEKWKVIKMENISFTEPVFILEESRKGFRLRKITVLGISQVAQLGELTKEEAWANRYTLEYS